MNHTNFKTIQAEIEQKRAERQGQIEWLTDLAFTIQSGDIETALESINAAIKLLEK